MVDDDVVAFADGLPAIPEKLLLARDRGEVLFITGAGISRPAPSSLPDFRELVVEVYDRLDTALAAKLALLQVRCRDDRKPQRQVRGSRVATKEPVGISPPPL